MRSEVEELPASATPPSPAARNAAHQCRRHSRQRAAEKVEGEQGRQARGARKGAGGIEPHVAQQRRQTPSDEDHPSGVAICRQAARRNATRPPHHQALRDPEAIPRRAVPPPCCRNERGRERYVPCHVGRGASAKSSESYGARWRASETRFRRRNERQPQQSAQRRRRRHIRPKSAPLIAYRRSGESAGAPPRTFCA